MSPIDDNLKVQIELTVEFIRWRSDLRDRRAVVKIADRLTRLAFGHWGDVKPVGDGVSELRIDHGPGYRLYAFKRNETWVVMLGGDDKSTQRRDIQRAKQMAKDLRDGD